jgi:hypothetical protein
MIKNVIKRIPQLKISSWYVLILCAFSTLLTSHLLSMYSTVHWPILTSSYNLKSHIENISEDEKANQIVMENENLRKFFDDLPNISDKIHTAGWELMGKTGLYHLTGLFSFLLAIFTFFCRPRWVGIIALPFGIYSLSLAAIIM